VTAIVQLLDWLAAWPGAVWLQQSGIAYLFVNAAHILGIGLLLGSILPFDLHLIGLNRSGSTAIIGPLLLRIAATGLALALMTGFWLFTVKPREYIENPAFLTKIALLVLALGNLAVQHMGTSFRAALRGEGVAIRVRLIAAISAMLWLSVLVAGRWIGFVAR
jgi:hypothetical protein